MQFLFHGRPTAETIANPPANLMDTVQRDWESARELYFQGLMRQIWGMGQGVIAICEADSREQLEALIHELPMSKAGLVEYDIEELTPYRGFAPEPRPA